MAFRPLAEALLSQFRDAGPPDSPELEPFRPVLGRLVPEWRGNSPEQADESIVLLAEAVLRVLRVLGRAHGCLIVLEDLHWADPDTMAIVEYLAENLASEPVVCLGTVRSEESSPGFAVASNLIARRVASALEVSPLSASEVSAMARACLDLASLPSEFEVILQECADGLPFLVEELLAGAAGAGGVVRTDHGWKVEPGFEPAVPRTFGATVVERLGALGPSARAVVGGAAVLGRRFDWTILPLMTEQSEREVLSALGRATMAQLLVCEQRGAGSFRFRHALTRDAVLGQLLPAERSFLARSALAAVEESHPDLDGEWCDLAAQLADQAGDRDRAAALLLQAGRRSLGRGALATAETTLERALSMASGSGERTLDVKDALCETLSSAGPPTYRPGDSALDRGALGTSASRRESGRGDRLRRAAGVGLEHEVPIPGPAFSTWPMRCCSGRAGERAQAEEAFGVGDAALSPNAWNRSYGRRLVAEAAIAAGWGEPAQWLQEALPVFEDDGHDQIAAACRSLLRRAGAPVPRRGNVSGIPTDLRSLGVTAREVEVLTLLAEGLQNREIATRLYLSPRTVERHIANLTVKAGVRSRSELIAFAARTFVAPSAR